MSGEGHLSGPRWPRREPLALSTPDPRFDPEQPLTVNGYPFEPAARAVTAIEDDDMRGGFDG